MAKTSTNPVIENIKGLINHMYQDLRKLEDQLSLIETPSEDLQSSKSEALGKLETCTRRFLSSPYFSYLNDTELPTIPLRELREKLSKIKVPLSQTIIEERRGR